MRVLLACLISISMFAQTYQVRRATNIDTGPTLPATCTVSRVFGKTGTAAGFYYCVATNTWKLVLGSSGLIATAQGGTGADLSAAGAGKYPKSNGATPAVFAASTLAASGIGECGANTWASTLNADAAPTCTQPAFSNVSGAAAAVGFEGHATHGALKGLADDVGRIWSDLGQQFSQTEIRSLAYLGNGVALAGTAGGGKILRSTDYGATWSDLGQQFSQTHIFSLAYLGNGVALAGTGQNGKILRSTDYGATWSDLGQQFSQTQILSLAYLGNGVALAGTAEGGKILRSSNW